MKEEWLMPGAVVPVALETVYETIIQWDENGGKRSRRELARRIVSLYTTPQPNTIANSEAIPEQISEHSPDCALLQIPSRDCDCGA